MPKKLVEVLYFVVVFVIAFLLFSRKKERNINLSVIQIISITSKSENWVCFYYLELLAGILSQLKFMKLPCCYKNQNQIDNKIISALMPL